VQNDKNHGSLKTTIILALAKATYFSIKNKKESFMSLIKRSEWLLLGLARGYLIFSTTKSSLMNLIRKDDGAHN
jgi:hypothetical protein